jgi:hypothetical protein
MNMAREKTSAKNKEEKPVDPWKFLGHKAAEMDVHSNTLEKKLAEANRTQASPPAT